MTISCLKMVLAAWLGLALLSCSQTHPEAGGDSSTHWLRRCASAEQCGSLSCVCGVCSTECGASSECAGLSAGAECLQGTSSACGAGSTAPRELCDQSCERDADCGGGGLACVEQRCRRASAASVPGNNMESTSDAGARPGVDAGDSYDAGASKGGSLSFRCAPQRAVSNGDECATSAGFAWNGATCEEIVCGCTGPDCDAIQPTRSACEAAFASCQPDTMCSGLPWYRCADHCPLHWVLSRGGRLLEPCEGECRFELSFRPNFAPGESCMSLDADLTIFNTDGSQRSVNMELNDAAWEEAALLSQALEDAPRENLAKCGPLDLDCHFAGDSAWFERTQPGAGVPQRFLNDAVPERFSYVYGAPPEGVRALDRFIQRLIDQGRVCRGDALTWCGSYSLLPSPSCGKQLPIVSTDCGCPVSSSEQLSSLEGTVCRETCGYCYFAESTCGANCTQPCAGGDPVWSTFCTE